VKLLILLGFWRDLRAASDFWAGHPRPSLNHIKPRNGEPSCATD
jgi:hypothetical protein